ncbi:MAG TPA: hypothetical protein DIU15_11170 [Deltaproteobacteria bacterium]|nr:hypothetical protein [Deltaproteobacteria bacterium]
MKASSGLGAVATGHPETTAAAISALEAGGNAMDAAVAAALTSTVCEPLLMGFGGGGLFTVRDGATGSVHVLDCFSIFPGLDHGLEPRDFRALRVDYGPTFQIFTAGRGAVAVPGVAAGIEAFHRRWCTLPLTQLTEHALHIAEEGWVATAATEVVATMLEPILRLTPESEAIFAPNDRPLQEGAMVRCPQVARALRDFAEQGAEPFVRGEHAQSLVDCFGPPHGSLGMADLDQFEPRWTEALSVSFRGSTLHVPPPPCSGGALLLFGLHLLDHLEKGEDRLWSARALARVMSATERARAEGFDEALFEPDSVARLLSEETLNRHAGFVREALEHSIIGEVPTITPPKGSIPGNTTHLSVVDRAGNAVAFTSSNGETCGTLWPGLSLTVNNFLGEEDIHPLGFHRGPPGAPFRTMMTPSLLVEQDGGVVAMGTGGSNRIRTAMLQVIRNLVDENMSLEDSVMAPRIHVEQSSVHVEDVGQGEGFIQAIAGSSRELSVFEGRHLYFGGVHSARLRGDGGLEAVGDPRRSGAGAIATQPE